MKFSQLKYIIAIADAGSINKAAEKLYISQPSLTESVKELERELGFRIFNRSSRGVTLTIHGMEFLSYARSLYSHYEDVMEKYSDSTAIKKKFGVSAQHYSFAVKAFVEMVKPFDMNEYEFAIRETITKDVIRDVSEMRSELGVLYLSDFNRKAILKLLNSADLEFHKLADCYPCVYVWKEHPLAKEEVIGYEQLMQYPCCSFEQGDDASFYLTEEIVSTNVYPRTIKVNDRATMLNLMVGLYGYTVCPGIICEELNGLEYKAVPYKMSETARGGVENSSGAMEIGYIKKKHSYLSNLAERYIEQLKTYIKHSE